MKTLSTVEWTVLPSGRVELYFLNHVTGADRYQIYKSVRSAKIAETKFHNRMNRVYGHLVDS